MENVTLELNDNLKGAFFIKEGEEKLGEMAVSITGDKLIVYHTEVLPKAEGKGLAKDMLIAMVDYARTKSLKVIPLCPYVHAQFERHPDEYIDVWKS
ncbi:MAG: GNAT family N-acetyltransferase [Candidatus Dadabacteria bacterium]